LTALELPNRYLPKCRPEFDTGEFLEALLMSRAIPSAARVVGTNALYVMRRMKRDPEFNEAVRAVVGQNIGEVEASLFKAAIDGVVETTVEKDGDGKILSIKTTKKAPDSRVQQFILRTRRPDEYSERFAVLNHLREIAGGSDRAGAVVAAAHAFEALLPGGGAAEEMLALAETSSNGNGSNGHAADAGDDGGAE